MNNSSQSQHLLFIGAKRALTGGVAIVGQYLVGRIYTGAKAGQLLLLLFLSTPIQESNQLPSSWYSIVYYTLITITAAVTRLLAAIVLMPTTPCKAYLRFYARILLSPPERNTRILYKRERVTEEESSTDKIQQKGRFQAAHQPRNFDLPPFWGKLLALNGRSTIAVPDQ